MQEPKRSWPKRLQQAAATLQALTPQGALMGLISPDVRRAQLEQKIQTNAFVRSAANTVGFHLPDRAQAATDALFDRRNLPFGQKYADQLAKQRRLNDEFARRAPLATMLGQGGGAVAGVMLVAPEYLAATAVPRIAGATGLTAREGAALLGAGAATNAGMQVATDAATGQKPTVKHTAAAGVGGAVGSATLPFVGGARAAAITGGTTSALQDVLDGRPISIEAAAQAGILGALLGNAGAKVGRAKTNALSPSQKGRLGEQLGAARSWINGEGDTLGPKARDYIDGTPKYWYPDRRAGEVRFEDKFGYQADLSANQRLAREALGDSFRLNHFVPEDIGSVTGLSLGMAGASTAPEFIRLPDDLQEIIAANRAKRSSRQ